MRWLAELSHGLGEAEKILRCFEEAGLCNADTLDAGARIEAAREEVRSLRLGPRMQATGELSPERTNQSIWKRSSRDLD